MISIQDEQNTQRMIEQTKLVHQKKKNVEHQKTNDNINTKRRRRKKKYHDATQTKKNKIQ